jgi:hypothetical protein
MMQVKDLTQTQRDLLDTAIEQAMISAAALALTDESFRARMQRYHFQNPDCSAADMIQYALGDFAKTHVTYRPFEFNEFLESLGVSE